MKTPSKINAFLTVTGRRPDGYHTIETLFLPLASPHDEIRITPAPERQIVTDAPIPCDARNLCWQAVDRFKEHYSDATEEWEIEIKKSIPIAGGMAGGSSDAAAVLRLLNDHYGNPFDNTTLCKIALALGADVPFFIDPVPSRAEGVGEILTPVADLPHLELPLILVFPDFPIPAAWAYTHRVGEFAPKGEIDRFIERLRTADLETIVNAMRNDLAPAAFEKFPLLRIIRDTLYACGARKVELSGSGPTLFAVMSTLEDAQQCARELPWRTFVTTASL